MLRLADDGRPETRFTAVRTHKAPTGEIVVLDYGTSELRVFSPAGNLLRILSRTGEGPGELPRAGNMWKAGDTIVVPDNREIGKRIHYFTASTGFLRSGIPAPRNANRQLIPLRYVSDGVLLVRHGAQVLGSQPGVPAGRLSRDSITLGLVSSLKQDDVVWLGTFPAGTLITYASPIFIGHIMPTSYPHGPSLAYGVSGNAVWMGDSGTGQITIFDGTGSRVREFRVPLDPRPFEVSALEAVRDKALSADDRGLGRAMDESQYNLRRLPETTPFFTAFLPGIEGEMWLRQYSELPSAPARFVVVDERGRGVASVLLPAGFSIHDAGRDYVLGVERDRDGVTQVVEYSLRRQPPPG